MNVGRDRPHEVYRSYDEEETLAGGERGGIAPDLLGGEFLKDRPDARAGGDFLGDVPDGRAGGDFPGDLPDGRPGGDFVSDRPGAQAGGDFLGDRPDAWAAAGGRRRVRPTLLVAAGVGVLVFATTEMHASVGRVTRPVAAPPPGAPPPRAARRSRRTVRRVAKASDAGPIARFARSERGSTAAPTATMPADSPTLDGAPASADTATSTPNEFGFER